MTSLWFIIAAHDFLKFADRTGHVVAFGLPERLTATIEAILAGYAKGTRFGISADTDGLLRAGQPGIQLTWMDAKVGDAVVTPRIGKRSKFRRCGSTHFTSAGRDRRRGTIWRKTRARHLPLAFSIPRTAVSMTLSMSTMSREPWIQSSGPTRFWRSAAFPWLSSKARQPDASSTDRVNITDARWAAFLGSR